MNENSISLNKFISNTGVCSRREADTLIEEGRVSLNGKVAKKGNRVNEGDTVKVDGKSIGSNPKFVYLALNKPPGITSTTDLRDRDNIISFLNHPNRIFPIGRLDKASTGLILLTNDGDIVNKILRAENKHEKEYIVVVNRPVTKNFVNQMANGVPILGTKTKKCEVEILSKNTFRITLVQGLNRQIRRMCEHFGYKVTSLKRIRIMNIQLDVDTGYWRDLTKNELKELRGNLE